MEYGKNLRNDAEDLLTGLLSWWSEKALTGDGFHGRVTDDGTPVEGAPRGLILAARLLWTYSSAYRVTGKTEYRHTADTLYRYLRENFTDRTCGGLYFEISADGVPTKDYKHTYGEAFALYAFSEYARAAGEKAALCDAEEAFLALERAHDGENGGYFEVLHRDNTPAPEIVGTNQTSAQEKTMNTSLHVMEALTAYLRVRENEKVRARLREMFDLFMERILNTATGHFFMFFDRAWNHDGFAESYGHDIEGSWLLSEAAEVLGDADRIEKARKNAVYMTDAVLRDGMTDQNALTSEYDPVSGGRTARISWWEQNEAVVGCYNAYQITGEENYLRQAEKTMAFILGYHIDRQNGGYYAYLNPDFTPAHGDKANMWICPYHNGRMAMELAERIGTN